MRNLNVLVLALVAAPLLGGCYARVRGSGYVYTPAPRVYVAPRPVYVAPQPAYVAPPPPQAQVVYDEDFGYVTPPPSVESYPYVVYNGQPTYYVQGRWYRRHQSGSWVVYNTEPGYLATERGRRGWTVSVGPTYGAPPPVYAPPAQPVYRPGYTTTTTVTTAPPAYGGGGSFGGGGGGGGAVRATTSAPPAH